MAEEQAGVERWEDEGADPNIFACVQHCMAEDFKVMDPSVVDSMDRQILRELYLHRGTTYGIAHVTKDELGFITGLKRDQIEESMDRLEAVGQVVQAGPHTILMNWRRWCGTMKQGRDSAGQLVVSKGAARHALKVWPSLTAKAQEAYLRTCELAVVGGFDEIIKRPTKQGRPPKGGKSGGNLGAGLGKSGQNLEQTNRSDSDLECVPKPSR